MAQLSPKLPWELAQTKWSSTLNPFLAMPIFNGNMVTGINLLANKPQAINHLLGRMPQGWILTDNTANTVVWRTQDFNQFSITLEATANTTISIWVF
jgi:Tfp pilus assembly protein PilN